MTFVFIRFVNRLLITPMSSKFIQDLLSIHQIFWCNNVWTMDGDPSLSTVPQQTQTASASESGHCSLQYSLLVISYSVCDWSYFNVSDPWLDYKVFNRRIEFSEWQSVKNELMKLFSPKVILYSRENPQHFIGFLQIWAIFLFSYSTLAQCCNV